MGRRLGVEAKWHAPIIDVSECLIAIVVWMRVRTVEISA